MIGAIELRNFQSHEYSKLKLSKGVNAIVGDTNSGKTAILRALYWLIYNRPSGDRFRSHWASNTENCAIDITTLHEGVLLSRFRGKENGYCLNDETLKAIGTEVPEEIATILNINDINIQRQMDSHFLLSSSPAEVARVLNQAVRLSDIDVATKNIRKRYNQTHTEIKQLEASVEECEEKQSEFAYLSDLKKDLEKAEQLEDEIRQTRQDASDIRNFISDWDRIQKQLKKTKYLDSIEVQDIRASIEEIQEMRKKGNDLELLISQIESKQVHQLECTQRIDKSENELKQLIKGHCPMCKQKLPKGVSLHG